jgi:hypothetical protein
MKYAVVIDVGCIECGEETKVIYVSHDPEEAYQHYKKYIKEHDETDAPNTWKWLTKQLQSADERADATELDSTGYFSSGQHSVELHLYPNVKAFLEAKEKKVEP